MPGKSHGRRSLEGCSPWGRWGSDTTKRLHFHFSLSCIGEGNGNPLQCSCLENPRDWGAWWAAVCGVAQSQTRLKRLSSSSSNSMCVHPFATFVLLFSIYICIFFFLNHLKGELLLFPLSLHHAPLPLILHFVFPRSKNHLLYNHSTIIKIRNFIIDIILFLIRSPYVSFFNYPRSVFHFPFFFPPKPTSSSSSRVGFAYHAFSLL